MLFVSVFSSFILQSTSLQQLNTMTQQYLGENEIHVYTKTYWLVYASVIWPQFSFFAANEFSIFLKDFQIVNGPCIVITLLYQHPFLWYCVCGEILGNVKEPLVLQFDH